MSSFSAGSLMNGYASSLFANFCALMPKFRKEWGHDQKLAFTRAYGYRKLSVDYAESAAPEKRGKTVFGAMSDRRLNKMRAVGEAPGVLPSFLTQYLLATSIIVHKSDLDQELPTCDERPAPIACSETELDIELHTEYRRLRSALLTRIKADRFDPTLSGKLLGALNSEPAEPKGPQMLEKAITDERDSPYRNRRRIRFPPPPVTPIATAISIWCSVIGNSMRRRRRPQLISGAISAMARFYP